jgi:hypothetical protein
VNRSVLIAIAVAGAAACSDDAPPGTNPSRLYLALMGSERMVQLVEQEPPPY